ncbi:UNVERIFIED_CONTAM: hypothetical protein N8J90_16285 [Halobacillus marinus]
MRITIKRQDCVGRTKQTQLTRWRFIDVSADASRLRTSTVCFRVNRRGDSSNNTWEPSTS